MRNDIFLIGPNQNRKALLVTYTTSCCWHFVHSENVDVAYAAYASETSETLTYSKNKKSSA